MVIFLIIEAIIKSQYNLIVKKKNTRKRFKLLRYVNIKFIENNI